MNWIALIDKATKEVEDIKLCIEELKLQQEKTYDLVKSQTESGVVNLQEQIMNEQNTTIRELMSTNAALLEKIATLEAELEKYSYTE